MTPPQIGICTWSLNRDDVRDAVTVARDKLGLSLVQVGFFGPGIPDESADAGLVDYLAASGVRVSATWASKVRIIPPSLRFAGPAGTLLTRPSATVSKRPAAWAL